MKKLLRSQNLSVAIAFIILFLAACGAHNKLSSPSHDFYKKAKKQWRHGSKASALFSASNGVIADPVYTNSKEFLYENYDQTMKDLHAELTKYQNTKDTAEAKRQDYIYKMLVKINANVAKMEMPLKHHKDKWQWSAEAKDYTQKSEDAEDYAYKVFFDFGAENLRLSMMRGSVKNAFHIFVRGHNHYRDNDEKQASMKNIQDEFFKYGDTHKNAGDWKETIAAADAFSFAEEFDNDTKRAKKGREYTAKRISVLLTEQGKIHTQKGDIQSLLEASDFYKNAIAWDETNTEAAKLKEELKPIVAEAYYKKAQIEDKKQDADLAETRKLYEAAIKWVSGYKDCQARIYSLSIRH